MSNGTIGALMMLWGVIVGLWLGLSCPEIGQKLQALWSAMKALGR